MVARGKDIDGSMSVPTFYGKELQVEAGGGGAVAGGVGRGQLLQQDLPQRIEHGERRMPLDLAQHVDQKLGTDGFFERHCEEVRKARRRAHAAYFEKVLEAEKHAETIEEWCPTLLPGLLQTPAVRAGRWSGDPSRRPPTRGWRRRSTPAWHAPASSRKTSTPRSTGSVLHESLSRRPDPPAPGDGRTARPDHGVGGTASDHSADHSAECGAHPLMAASIMFMTFPDAPPLMYTEASYSGDTIDDPALVKQYRKAYDRLRAAALSPEASLAMIKAAAEEYRNGKQPDRLE